MKVDFSLIVKSRRRYQRLFAVSYLSYQQRQKHNLMLKASNRHQIDQFGYNGPRALTGDGRVGGGAFKF
jgi:hypothetical protein